MRINKLLSLLLIAATLVSFTGCGKEIERADIDSFTIADEFGLTNEELVENTRFFAEDLCVVDSVDIGVNTVTSEVCTSAAVFNLDQKKVTYAQNMHGKIYPASTTKIMTCMLILENGNLDDYTTVSANAAKYDETSSKCYIKEGDVISVRDLLYGLMIPSGNDAATALAEYLCNGNEEAFVDMMNEKARSLGCTNTHFVTTHGLHDDDHYTTAYDMYLIFKEAIKNEMFVKLISTTSYKASYTNAAGQAVTREYGSSNRFLATANRQPMPKNIIVIGGKTGTTEEAGYCLVLLSKNASNEDIVSIVYNADCKANLYYMHSQILAAYGNQ